jgi:hypothetical protein
MYTPHVPRAAPLIRRCYSAGGEVQNLLALPHEPPLHYQEAVERACKLAEERDAPFVRPSASQEPTPLLPRVIGSQSIVDEQGNASMISQQIGDNELIALGATETSTGLLLCNRSTIGQCTQVPRRVCT